MKKTRSLCKFKPNMLTTFMFTMLEVIGPLCLCIPVMILLTGHSAAYSPDQILSIVPACLLMMALTVVVCSIVNLVTYPFTKRHVTLSKDAVSRDRTSVKYDDITLIELDSGMITRMGPSESCCLNCYSFNDLVLSIEHPSLVMSFLLLKRCKNAKFRYKRMKKVFLIWAGTLLLSIALGFYGATGGQ